MKIDENNTTNNQELKSYETQMTVLQKSNQEKDQQIKEFIIKTTIKYK